MALIYFHFRELIAINKLLKWVLHIFAPNGSIHARLIKYENYQIFVFVAALYGIDLVIFL